MTRFISLSGGLGNQLFQIAGAISVYKSADFKVEWSIGITNVNSNGAPEVFDYKIPNSIQLLPKQNPTKLQRKFAHLVLRRSSSRRVFPGPIIAAALSGFLSMLLIPYIKTFAKVIFPSYLDANQVESKRNRSEYLIGFFHSNLWVSPAARELLFDKIEPRIIDPYVVKLEKVSKIKKPIILHIRLGDYEKEEKFGILPTKYYEEALNLLSDFGIEGEIWIFTNDMLKAREIFPKEYEARANWIPNFSNSSVQILEAMRLGSAYVIGNSTFSWWAASLSKDRDARVIAPEPWFRSAPTHENLLPKNWITINPW